MDKRLEKLSQLGIYLGTSSWKYPGWKGLVYRGSYSSEKDFKERSLEEYSLSFSSVGVDHTYYGVPTVAQLKLYQQQTPPGFKFIFKAPEQTTVYQYPNLPRYGKKAGTLNQTFLDGFLLKDSFLDPLKILGPKVGGIVFEFSKFRRGSIESGSEFVKRLDDFLRAIRKTTEIPIGVEIRNRNWLVPTYFKVLEKNQAAHVFNSWTEMPDVSEQWKVALPFQLPFFIFRLLLKGGTPYQKAINAFQPYDRIQMELPELRRAAAQAIESSLAWNKKAFILVNNRFEGCAPRTIDGILELLNLRLSGLLGG